MRAEPWRLYVLAVAIAAAAVLVWGLTSLGAVTGSAVAAAVAVAVLSAFPVRSTIRPGGVTVSLDGIAVPMLLLVPAPAAVVAVAVGAGLGRALAPLASSIGHRRRANRWTYGFNISSVVLVMAVAHAAARLWHGWAGLVIGLVVWHVLSAGMTAVVVRLATAATWRDVLSGAAFPLDVVAAVTGLLVVYDGLSLTTLAVAVAAVVPVSMLSERLLVERHERDVLRDAAEEIHRATHEGNVPGAIVAATARALGARTVELTAERGSHDIAVPVSGAGWLGVSDRDHPAVRRFHQADAASLHGIAAVAAVALENERLLGALRDAESHRAVLMAAAAHDLRSPLTTVRGATETLQVHGDRLADHDREALLGSISRSTAKALRLIEDLLELERVALTGHVGASGSASEAARRVAADIDDPRVTAELQDGTADVAMPTSALERVLDNLVRNALKHSPPDADVEVRVADRSSEVLVTVSDRGPGIPEEVRGRLFDPFVQASDAASGVGLGLHVTRSFVVRYGGRLWVEDRDGGGSTFALAIRKADAVGTV